MALNTNINIPQSPFLEPQSGRPSREWMIWLMNPNVVQLNLSNPLPVTSGGTGLNIAPTNGQLLIGNNGGYSLNTLTGSNAIDIASGAGSIALDLSDTGVAAGTYGSNTIIPRIEIDSQGRIISAQNMVLNPIVPSDNVTYLAPFTSAVTRTGTSKWSDIVSVKDFGAVGNGSNDDTNAIQAAINTGKKVYIPTGTYYITNALTITTAGQMICGDGKDRSFLKITSSFNMSASGVIICSTGEPGPELCNFGMLFTQPDTNNRASLTSYPVAIYARGTPRCNFHDLKITNATNGIDLRDNSGGSYIDLLHMSAYATGILIDGALDTMRVNRYHFYNFDMTANQASIFYTAPTRAFSIGRVDGLFIHEFLNISNLGIAMYQGVSGPPWVYITDSGFDTFNGINQTAGRLEMLNSYITNADGGGYYGHVMSATDQFAQFTNCYFSAGPSNGMPMFLLADGSNMKVTLENCTFEYYIQTSPMIYVNTAAANSWLSVSGCTFNFYTANTACVWSEGNAQQKVHLVNNYINTTPNTAYSLPMFQFQSGCRTYITGNRINDKGSNAAVFIQNNGDNYNWISGNIAPGWTNNGLAGTTGYYANNLT